ncbi:hypothetical protein ACLK1T_28435 [Escherichia coli]
MNRLQLYASNSTMLPKHMNCYVMQMHWWKINRLIGGDGWAYHIGFWRSRIMY